MEGAKNSIVQLFRGIALEKISYFILGLTVILSPIFFVPSQFFSLQFSKSTFIFTGILLAFVLLLVASLREGKFIVPTNLLSLSIIVLPAVFLLASFRVGKSFIPSILPQSFFGYGFEVGTFAFILLMTILVYEVVALIRTRERIFKVQTFFLLILLLVAIFQIVRLVVLNIPQSIGLPILSFLSFGVFTSAVSSFLGSWNDLGIFFALGVFLSLIALETLSLNRLFKVFTHCALWISICFLAVIDFTLLWEIITIFSLLLLVYFISIQKFFTRLDVESPVDSSEVSSRLSTPKLKRVPGALVAVFIISLIFTAVARLPVLLVWTGGNVSGQIAGALKVSNTEVRPSWNATFEVARNSLMKSPIVGVGPNRFTYDWLAYKPEGINGTPFWNTDFSYGVGLLPTFAVTTGIIGIIAWLFFFGTFILVGLRAIFVGSTDTVSRYVYLSTFFPALFLWVVAVTYVPGIVIITLAFFFTGLFMAAAIQGKIVRSKLFTFNKRPRTSFVASLVIVIVAIGSGVFAYNMFQKSLSSFFFQKAVFAYQSGGDLDLATLELNKALSLNATDLYYRSFSELGLARMRAILSQGDSSANSVQLFSNTLVSTLNNASFAIAKDRMNYQNWLTLGGIYESLISLKLEQLDAYKEANTSYDEAFKRNPKSPLILLLKARLEASHGDYAKAKNYIGQVLFLKRDYTDAIFLLSQIQVNEGNVKDAIISVEAALSISPNDPYLYFQLGLLQYNVGTFPKAIAAFENAVYLVPTYSNAKYFLGLSYQKVGRTKDAILQFEDVGRLNPNNKEVALILSNLRAGRDPFVNAKPPVDDKPEKRSEPPVKEENQ